MNLPESNKIQRTELREMQMVISYYCPGKVDKQHRKRKDITILIM